MVDLTVIVNLVVEGKGQELVKLVEQAISEGMEADRVLREGLIAGMDVVGARMRRHEIFVPEVLNSAKVMHAGLDLLTPLLITGGLGLGPKVVLGTVKGDLHDIGKNLVGMMLKGSGFQVIDLGVDVSAARFVAAVGEQGASVVAMSSLLTTTMPEMGRTIEALKGSGLRGKVRVVIGGAPVSLEYAEKVGADGYAADASRAVDKVKELLQ